MVPHTDSVDGGKRERPSIPGWGGARWQRPLAVLTAAATVIAAYLVFVYAPEERTMGAVQRIFYLHVGLAWNAYLSFFIVTVSGAAYLVGRNWRWDAVAKSAGELGVLFTTLTLLTGMLWARPVWNVWWTWDPRLTTTLILWFMYVAYLLVREAIDGEERRARVSAVFGILAFLNVPIVHFSARWWRGLHPIIIDVQGARPTLNMEPAMAVALWGAVAAVTLWNGYLLLLRADVEFFRVHVDRLKANLSLTTD